MKSDINKYHELLTSGTDVNDLLRTIRADGHSVIESIVLLRELQGTSLEEAKAIVHLSDAWADQRKQMDDLHDAAEKAAKELGE